MDALGVMLHRPAYSLTEFCKEATVKEPKAKLCKLEADALTQLFDDLEAAYSLQQSPGNFSKNQNLA